MEFYPIFFTYLPYLKVSGVRFQMSGLKGGDGVTTSNYMDVEDLEVYKN